MSLSLGLQPQLGGRTLIQRAIASLRARGSDAHLWLPGGDVRTYGPELVVNGGFADATGWANSSGTDWTFSTGVAVRTATAAANGFNTAMAHQAGKAYKVTFEIVSVTNAASGISAYIGSASTAARSAVGTYTEVIVSDGVSPTNLRFFPRGAGGFAGSIDNISVREITSITPTITSGLTTGNYLESTGNSVATVNNPVGLVLDALGSVGAELVTNGGFADATGWTVPAGWAVGSGVAAGTATSSSLLCTQYTPVTGKTYLVTFDCTVTGGTLYVATGSGTAASFTTSGPKRCILVCGATPSRAIEWYGGAVSGSVDNISVREVSGIHLTQGTTANKPIVQRGLWNLLTYSSDFSNAAWTKSSLTVTGSQADPNGGSSAYKLTPAALAEQHAASSTNVSAGTYTWAVIAKNTGYNLGISCYDGAYKVGSIFNLSSGTVTVSTAGSVSEILPLGAGWYLCTVTATLTASSSFGGFAVRPNIAGVSISEAVVGDGVSSVTVYRAGLFQGTLTASQILASGGIPVTTTAAASNPDSGKYSWAFDGSNDSLLTGNLGITNACTIVIAGRLDSLGAYNTLIGEDTNGVGVTCSATGAVTFEKVGISALATSPVSTIVAGIPFVITVRLSGGTAVIRKNGAQVATASGLSFSATTGARIGNAFSGGSAITGTLGMAIPMSTALTDAECLLIERMAASQFPNSPVF